MGHQGQLVIGTIFIAALPILEAKVLGLGLESTEGPRVT